MAVETPMMPNINVVIALHVAFLIGFDYLSPEVQSAFSVLINLAYLWIVFRRSLFVDRQSGSALIIVFVLMIVPWLASYLLTPFSPSKSLFSLEAGVRNLSALLIGTAILQNADKISDRVIYGACMAIVLYALAMAATAPAFVLDGSVRIAWFSANLHSSAYALAICVIYLGWRVWVKPQFWGFLLFCAATCLLIGYGVRTAWILVLVPVALMLGQHVKAFLGLKGALGNFIQALGIVALIGVSTLLLAGAETVDALSSGRLSNYLERWDLIRQWDWSTLLFGLGSGSDALIAQVWGGAAKDAHSDLLHLFWETGCMGLALALVVLLALRSSAVGAAKTLWWALIITSCVSNAILARPNVAMLFFAVMALLAVSQTRAKPGKQPVVGKSVGLQNTARTSASSSA